MKLWIYYVNRIGGGKRCALWDFVYLFWSKLLFVSLWDMWLKMFRQYNRLNIIYTNLQKKKKLKKIADIRKMFAKSWRNLSIIRNTISIIRLFRFIFNYFYCLNYDTSDYLDFNLSEKIPNFGLMEYLSIVNLSLSTWF